MSETKSYGISLNFSDRISLFISGAHSWKQFINNDAFYLKQSEIQFLTNARLNNKKFICFFERDFKIHHLPLDKTAYSLIYTENQSLIRSWFVVPAKIFKYQVVSTLALFSSFFVIFALLSFFKLSSLQNYFLSKSCDSHCADFMGKFSFVPALFLLCALGIPISYFMTRYFFNRFSKFKCSSPVLEFFSLAMMVLPITVVIHDALSRPVAQVIYDHWRSGSLNQTTIGKIKSEFKSKSDTKRNAAAASEKATK